MKKINKLEFKALEDTSKDNRVVNIQVKSLRKIINKTNELVDEVNKLKRGKDVE